MLFKEMEAQPPRLLFGAPSSRTLAAQQARRCEITRIVANGKGAVGSARGGRAPHLLPKSSASGRLSNGVVRAQGNLLNNGGTRGHRPTRVSKRTA